MKVKVFDTETKVIEKEIDITFPFCRQECTQSDECYQMRQTRNFVVWKSEKQEIVQVVLGKYDDGITIKSINQDYIHTVMNSDYIDFPYEELEEMIFKRFEKLGIEKPESMIDDQQKINSFFINKMIEKLKMTPELVYDICHHEDLTPAERDDLLDKMIRICPTGVDLCLSSGKDAGKFHNHFVYYFEREK
jgi:hypothetical protein